MNVEIFTAMNRDGGLVTTSAVASLLLGHGCTVYVPRGDKKLLPKEVLTYACHEPDLEIALGGDGTIMRAVRRVAGKSCPVIGVNLGHVGYLTELPANGIQTISSFFSGDYTVEKRTMLKVTHRRKEKVIGKPGIALNDAVLTHGAFSRMLDIEVFADDMSLGKYRSDGFIVSTPTGSTAYSISAGGPVMDPQIRGFCLVPLCPHSLTARPMVVSDSCVIRLNYLGHGGKVYLSLDGDQTAEVVPGDTIEIALSECTADFVRFGNAETRSFYTTLRDKLSGL